MVKILQGVFPLHLWWCSKSSLWFTRPYVNSLVSSYTPLLFDHYFASTISSSKPSHVSLCYIHYHPHLANCHSCCSSPLEWHFLRQACLSLPPQINHVPFTIITNSKDLFQCSLAPPSHICFLHHSIPVPTTGARPLWANICWMIGQVRAL